MLDIHAFHIAHATFAGKMKAFRVENLKKFDASNLNFQPTSKIQKTEQFQQLKRTKKFKFSDISPLFGEIGKFKHFLPADEFFLLLQMTNGKRVSVQRYNGCAYSGRKHFEKCDVFQKLDAPGVTFKTVVQTLKKPSKTLRFSRLAEQSRSDFNTRGF